jgi:hypothetical protein
VLSECHKCDLGGEKTMLNDFERQFARIFYILGIKKGRFGRILESYILSRRIALRSDILRSGLLKNVFGTSIKRCL